MEDEKKDMTDEEFDKILDDFFNAFKALPEETINKMSENIDKMENNKNND